jgi:H+/Cl- antiporter ClcA
MPRKRLKEGGILFISILKWFVLATIIGVIVGASTTFFLKSLAWSIKFMGSYPLYFLALPAALLISVLLITRLAPDAEGHGTEKVIEAVHKRFGKINAVVVPVKLVTTIFTIAAGGSAGKEGPCAQIGAGLASVFSDIFKFSDAERRVLVICGVSAGFASVFGTPIAGAIFGVEVLFAGRLLYDTLLPSIIAGMVSFQISSYFGISYFSHTINFAPVFTKTLFLEVFLAGIFFGICAFVLIEMLTFGGKLAKRLSPSKPLRALAGGTALIALTFIFSGQYLGLGLDTIKSAIEGGPVPWYAFFVKSLFTSITLNFGGSGGIITPVLFAGTTSGTLFAQILHLDTGTYAALGLVGVLAGATNTPIAASIMAVELFGAPMGPYAALVCVISYFMTGHRSVYPSQVFEIQKSALIDYEHGKQVGDIQNNIQVHRPRLTRLRKLAGEFIKHTEKPQKNKDSVNNKP